MSKKYFYNAHTHIFNMHHIPDEFAKGSLPFGITIRISWMRKTRKLDWLIRNIPKLFRDKNGVHMAERLINTVKHGEGKNGEVRTQKEIFKELQGYYPKGTRFIVLPMDMDYMDAGKAPIPYKEQIKELEQLKLNPEFSELIYPFVFADPRRFDDEPEYLQSIKTKVSEGIFSGIKMYPALGYWAFDERLKGLYDFCLGKNLPIITHCVAGVVHWRGKKEYSHHPISSDIALAGKKAKDFSIHFSHPLNFHFLMERELLSRLWKLPLADTPDYSKLKVCLAHFGGSSQWKNYLRYPWYPNPDNLEKDAYPALEEGNWNFSIDNDRTEYSWFTVIRQMINKYENVYADISFTLFDQEIWPLLKVLLSNPESKIRKRVLFGTDHYVVSQMGTERELSLGIRAFLGEEIFHQIAFTNVEEFLGGGEV